MAVEGTVPVQESVGSALRFVRENLTLILVIAGIGAAAVTLVGVASSRVPALALPLSLVATLASAFVYAALSRAALGAGGDLAADGGRVWAAMAIVGLFLCIVFVVLAIPGIILFAVMIAPRYGAGLEAAAGDPEASLALMSRIATENPGMLLGFALFYILLWLALTSRLYLAAPASIDQKRILTFETWAWTKGNMVRIMGARVMLLLPAYVLLTTLSYLAARGLGMDLFDPLNVATFAASNLPAYALFSFASSLLSIGLYRALEAGLSAHLYRGLRPQANVAATFD